MIHINCYYKTADSVLLVLRRQDDSHLFVAACNELSQAGTPEMLFLDRFTPNGEPHLVDIKVIEEAEFLNTTCSDCIYLMKNGASSDGLSDHCFCGLRVGFDQIHEYRRELPVDCAFRAVTAPAINAEDRTASAVKVKEMIRAFTARNGITVIDSYTYCLTPFIINELIKMLKSDDDVFLCSGKPIHEHLREYAEDTSPDKKVLAFKARDFSCKVYCYLNSEISEAAFKVLVIPALDLVSFSCEKLEHGMTMGYSVSAPKAIVDMIHALKKKEDGASHVL